MAKLNKKMQEQTEKASSGFEPMPDGVYHFRLRDVDATRSGPKGPYWSWEYECVEEPHVGRRQWNNTSLSEAAAFKMQETYKAFEVPLDTDTDDMIGGIVRLQLSTRTIQAPSPRAGEMTNQVEKVLTKDSDFELPDSAVSSAAPGSGGGGPAADEVIF
jgi:hypothetical protein